LEKDERAKQAPQIEGPGGSCNGATILVVDDEKSMRELLSIMLLNDGYHADTAASVAEAGRKLRRNGFDLVITDLKMGKDSAAGMKMLEKVRETDRDVPVIMITAYGSVDTAIEAMKKGAIDYVQKPFKNEEMRIVIKKALEQRRLRDENARLRAAAHLMMGGLEEIVGKSKIIDDVRELTKRVAGLSSTVLIRGESGTGKELVARGVHRLGPRSDHPFVAVNCAGIPESLLESELFGHKKGAFTGAIEDKKGLFEAATGGTLFLDEIGDMPPALQVKLLRVLDERVVRPVGTADRVAVDVRVISATNKKLEDEVEKRGFREDLFYRLNVIPIRLPALRERREDIPLLAGHFLAKYAERLRKDVTSVSPEAMSALEMFNWPGNIRQLENTVERAVALSSGPTVEMADLPRNIVEYCPELHEEENTILPSSGVDLERRTESIERSLISQALAKTQYSQKKAAQLLNLPVRSLRYRLKKYGMSPNGQREGGNVKERDSVTQQDSSQEA
jgi:two-component system response regulator PilR (NtrC family)